MFQLLFGKYIVCGMLDECYDFTVTLKLLYLKGFVATLKSENVFLVTQVWCQLICIKVCMEIIVQHTGHMTLW